MLEYASTKLRENSITVLLLGILYAPNTVQVQHLSTGTLYGIRVPVMSTEFREKSITVLLLGILYAPIQYSI